MLTNSNIPYFDNSLPNPLFLIPPNGTLGPDITTLFTVTIPDSTALASVAGFTVLNLVSVCFKDLSHPYQVSCHPLAFVELLWLDLV